MLIDNDSKWAIIRQRKQSSTQEQHKYNTPNSTNINNYLNIIINNNNARVRKRIDDGIHDVCPLGQPRKHPKTWMRAKGCVTMIG
jgi:hypothetical protein